MKAKRYMDDDLNDYAIFTPPEAVVKAAVKELLLITLKFMADALRKSKNNKQPILLLPSVKGWFLITK